jgi:uroporphyrinogen-III synthase
MNSSKLQNKVFISTRPKGKSEDLKRWFAEEGATLLEFPMIEIQPVPLSGKMEKILNDLSRFDWLVFTSPNGIRCFFEQLKTVQDNYSLPENMKIATVGKKTAAKLALYGHSARFINHGQTGDEFSEELYEQVTDGQQVLLPVGNLARHLIEEKLAGKAEVVRLEVYQTVMPEVINGDILRRIEADDYELMIFTSPSGIDNFRLLTENIITPSALRIACIGFTTAKAAGNYGIEPVLVASMSNSEGLMVAIADHYNIAFNV